MKIIFCILFLFLSGNSEQQKAKVISWKLVQLRHASLGCIDTITHFSWKHNCGAVSFINHIHGRKDDIIEESGNNLFFLDILLNGKKVRTATGTTQSRDVVSYDLKTRTKSEGKIVSRTSKFLFISWKPGSINIYQTTASGTDSVSIGVMNSNIIESGRLFGKKITYCNGCNPNCRLSISY